MAAAAAAAAVVAAAAVAAVAAAAVAVAVAEAEVEAAAAAAAVAAAAVLVWMAIAAADAEKSPAALLPSRLQRIHPSTEARSRRPRRWRLVGLFHRGAAGARSSPCSEMYSRRRLRRPWRRHGRRLWRRHQLQWMHRLGRSSLRCSRRLLDCEQGPLTRLKTLLACLEPTLLLLQVALKARERELRRRRLARAVVVVVVVVIEDDSGGVIVAVLSCGGVVGRRWPRPRGRVRRRA